jgi:riboflavin kinase
MHDFPSDFYDQEMRVLVLGYIRPEFDYVDRGMFSERYADLGGHSSYLADALIADIDTDKRVALNSLQRPEYEKFARDPLFLFH